MTTRGRMRPRASMKAGERTRTVNIQLGRLTLYQLSYTREGASAEGAALVGATAVRPKWGYHSRPGGLVKPIYGPPVGG